MLISDQRGILFVHVPKTGGVSVAQVVTEACPDARNKSSHPEIPLGWHAPLQRIHRAEPQSRDYWSFGFVRNPWARMVSWWSMIELWNRRHGPASGKPQDVTYGTQRDGNDMWRAAAAYEGGFEEFVLRGTDELVRVGKPQLSYLRTPAGVEVDFIGRTENLATDVAYLQRHLGVEETPLPHRNKSRHGSYRDYYSPATRDKVGEVYAEDVERFGYDF